jgi:hypothetical protein
VTCRFVVLNSGAQLRQLGRNTHRPTSIVFLFDCYASSHVALYLHLQTQLTPLARMSC